MHHADASSVATMDGEVIHGHLFFRPCLTGIRDEAGRISVVVPSGVLKIIGLLARSPEISAEMIPQKWEP